MPKKEELPMNLKMLKTYMKALSIFRPKLAAKVFVKHFTTPRFISYKPPHLKLLKEAVHFTFKANDVFKTGHKYLVQGYSWNNEGEKKILIVHGWNGKATDFYKMIPVLVANGYHVEAIDCKAHGQSEGKRSSLPEFMECIQTYIQKREMPHAIVAHSIGSTASFLVQKKMEWNIQKLIMLAPPVMKPDSFERTFNHFKFNLKTRSLILEKIEKRLKHPLSEFDLTQPSTLPDKTVLCLAVEGDTDVPNADTQLFINAHPQMEAHFLPDTHHNLIMREKQTIEKVLDFLKG